MKTYSLVLSMLCCSLLICGCGSKGSTPSSNSTSSSTKKIQLQDYIIRLVPYYEDEPSQDYRMVDNKLVHIYSDSYKTVCGTVDKINESAFELGVGGDYQDGGKLNPEKAAVFRGDEVIGMVTSAPYRFPVFDLNERKIYQNTADYENRNISDVEYLKFNLVIPGESSSQTKQSSSPSVDISWIYGTWSITTPYGTETMKIDENGGVIDMIGTDISTGSYTVKDGELLVKFSGNSIVFSYPLDMAGHRISTGEGQYMHKRDSNEGATINEVEHREDGSGASFGDDEYEEDFLKRKFESDYYGTESSDDTPVFTPEFSQRMDKEEAASTMRNCS